jgi:hypothetical protein
MTEKSQETEPRDPWRVAAVLLYARGVGSPAYVRERLTKALTRSDPSDAEFWAMVEAAVLTLLKPCSGSGETLQ